MTAIRSVRTALKRSGASREVRSPLPPFSLWSSVLAGALLAAGCGDGGSGPPNETLDLSVSAAYIVQSTQNRDGTVPLVAGKPGLLRVFVVANEANTPAPSVTVQLYSGATPTQTLSATATAAPTIVPTAVNQGSLANSWNYDLSGAQIQPGLRFLVTVDPQNTTDEANDDNNTFPASGTPQAVTVSAVAPLRLRFVPIHDTSSQLTGDINASNREGYLELTRKIMPVLDIDADIRPPYSVRGEGFDPQGNTWQAAVAELDAVRVAEGTNRYYYGVVKTAYPGGGVVGIASAIGGSTSLGWDRIPDHDETLAHELGHNWGRRHAPCGGAGGVDPSYPYTLGLIGVYGLDVGTREVKGPQQHTDIMGYCQAAFWISDYTYHGVFTWRLEHDQQTTGAAVPTLLVWGRIADGELVLEPAFEVVTRPVLPARSGPYTIEGLDDGGAILFSISFAGERLADVPGDHRQFAFAIPLDPATRDRLVTVRLRGRGREVGHTTRGRMSAALTGPAPQARAARRAGEAVAVEWDAVTHPAVMVRDARSGAILSIARDGRAIVTDSGSELELLLSDGVRTTRTRIRP